MFPRWSGRVPADAAVPGSSSSRNNPIHKQELDTGDGDWLPDPPRACVAKERREKGGTGGISVDCRVIHGCGGAGGGGSGVQEADVASRTKLLPPSLRHSHPPHPPPPPTIPSSSPAKHPRLMAVSFRESEGLLLGWGSARWLISC